MAHLLENCLAPRGFRLGILFCLVAAEILAAEVDDWSDAPAEWIIGLDKSAFCEAGARTFDARGEFDIVSENPPAPPARMTADDAFFLGYLEGPVRWSPDGPMREELTTFEVRRKAGSGLAMTGFIRDALAVARRFEVVKIDGSLWTRTVDAALCEDGRAPQVEIHHYRDGVYGKTYVRRARLAVAGDEALIVRFDEYSCRLCLSKARKRTYARFPATRNNEFIHAPVP